LTTSLTTSAGDQESENLAALESLVAAARGYLDRTISERTQTEYAKQWKAFATWADAHGLPALPAQPGTVALYLTARARQGLKVSTLGQAHAAIARAHKDAGYESPCKSDLVTDLLKGIRNVHGTAPMKKAALLPDQLRVVVAALPDTLLGARDRALLLVGFAGAFRRSELVAIMLADLTFSSDGMVIALPRSKTDQEGHGDKVGLPFGSSSATCPVRSLQTWIARASIRDGALFRNVDRHGNVGLALSDRSVALVVKRSVEAAGHDARDLSGHSLRAGLVTAAAKARRPAHVIMKQTRHRSVATVNGYIRDAELFIDNAADGLL
jgi:integrase